MIEVLPRSLAPIERHARRLASAWLATGADGCWLRSPDSKDCLLAGSMDESGTERTAPLTGVLRDWALVVSGEGVSQLRLDADAGLLSAIAQRTTEVGELAAALIEANDQMLALYDLAAISATSLEGRQLIESLVADACRLTRAAAAVIELDDGTTAASGDPDIAAELAAATDVSDDEVVRGTPTGQRFDLVSRRFHGEAAGTLVLASPSGERFSTPQLKLIDAVVDHVSGLLSLATMYDSALSSAVIEHDAKTAATLATMVLPSKLPEVPGLDLAARSDPARLAAGDFYTWSETPHGLVFAVGDVSGKGLGAALVMTMVAGACERAAHLAGDDPLAVLTTISREMYDYLDEASVFVTMLVGLYRPGDDHIALVNAGHSPVIARNGSAVTMIEPSGPPLGVFDPPLASVTDVPFRPGDTLLIGTDGLVEQQDSEQRQLGYDPLLQAVSQADGTSAASTLTAVFDLVAAHGGEATQDDDRTALVLCRSHDT